MKQYIKYLTLLIATGVIFSSGLTPVHAATCVIKGINLIMAEAKARGNGYKVRCVLKRGTHQTIMKNYAIPGPSAKVGCKGRQALPNVSKSRRSNRVLMFVYQKTLKHGWTISDLQVRGTNSVFKSSVKSKASIPAPGIGKSFNIYATKLFLKHRSKSCHNIPAVLTDAFGH